MLVAAFEVYVGRIRMSWPLLKYGPTCCPGIKPNVKNVSLFGELAFARLGMDKSRGENIRRIAFKPGISALACDEVAHESHRLSRDQWSTGWLSIEYRNPNAPESLSGNTPVWAARHHC